MTHMIQTDHDNMTTKEEDNTASNDTTEQDTASNVEMEEDIHNHPSNDNDESQAERASNHNDDGASACQQSTATEATTAWSTAPSDEKSCPGQHQHQTINSENDTSQNGIPPSVDHLSVDKADDDQSEGRHSSTTADKPMHRFKRRNSSTPSDECELQTREAHDNTTDSGSKQSQSKLNYYMKRYSERRNKNNVKGSRNSNIVTEVIRQMHHHLQAFLQMYKAPQNKRHVL
eukprot:15344998-Ditylum_brightwellii.AAC.1